MFKVVTVDSDDKLAYPLGADLVRLLTNSTVASVVPHYSGQFAVNTQNNMLYVATGTSAGNWKVQDQIRTISSLSDSSLYEGEIVKTSSSAYYIATASGSASWKSVFTADYVGEVAISTQTRTLQETDHGKVVAMGYVGDSTVTIPENSAVELPIGFQCLVTLEAGSDSTCVIAGTGITIKAAGGRLTLLEQYSGATLIKTGTNTWRVFGALE